MHKMYTLLGLVLSLGENHMLSCTSSTSKHHLLRTLPFSCRMTRTTPAIHGLIRRTTSTDRKRKPLEPQGSLGKKFVWPIVLENPSGLWLRFGESPTYLYMRTLQRCRSEIYRGCMTIPRAIKTPTNDSPSIPNQLISLGHMNP